MNMARRSLKEDLEDIRGMIARSKDRQEPKLVEPKTKVDGSKYQGAPISKANLQGYKDAQQQPKQQEQVAPKPPRSRPGPGREGMMAKAEEERKRRMRGQSAVIGG